MQKTIRLIEEKDFSSVTEIFNYYVANSFAAYPEKKLEESMFRGFLNSIRPFPVLVLENSQKQIIGFGLFKPFHPAQAFSQTAELTYFIHPDFTKQGLGSQLLKSLEEQAERMNINIFLANISSLNQASISFHEKNGFNPCGIMKEIGRKNNKVFDVIWMQKKLASRMAK